MHIFGSLLIFLLLLFPDVSAGQTIRVHVQGTPERTGYLDGIQSKGNLYFAAAEFAEILNINTYSDSHLEKLVLYIDGTQLTVTAGNPFIKIDNALYQMPVESIAYRSDIYVPVDEFVPLINKYLAGNYDFDDSERRLDIFPSGQVNITGMEVDSKENGTLVRIQTNQDFGDGIHHWFDDSKFHLTVQFYRGRLDTLQMTNTDTRGLVLRNTAIQMPEIAQITFRLSRYTDSYHLETDPLTGDILISLMKKGAEVGDQEPYIPPVPDSGEIVAKEREAWKIDTIIIDPGHGGKDPGTVGPNKLYEKDIVLDIGLQLKKLLEQSKLFDKIVMTRETDVFVPLMERSEIAKRNNGKLFVSIHVNGNKNKRLRGFEIYFLRPGKNDDALEVLEVVQKENDVMQLYENIDPERKFTEEEKMVLAMTQSAFVQESSMLAQHISEGIGRKVRWPNRGVKQAGFLVLWGTPMPNVLVEAGYITNSSQYKDLRTRAVRHRIAEGIFEGIRRFVEEARR